MNNKNIGIERISYYLPKKTITSKELSDNYGYDQEFIDWYIPKAQEFLSYVSEDKEPPRYKRKPQFNFNKEK